MISRKFVEKEDTKKGLAILMVIIVLGLLELMNLSKQQQAAVPGSDSAKAPLVDTSLTKGAASLK